MIRSILFRCQQLLDIVDAEVRVVEVHKAANCTILWSTYTCHLSGGEDAWQQEHLDRDSQDEDEGERQ